MNKEAKFYVLIEDNIGVSPEQKGDPRGGRDQLKTSQIEVLHQCLGNGCIEILEQDQEQDQKKGGVNEQLGG
ncbi:MAG: hypothetical protein EZS28_001863 [Streblomastix strix]|uniref:Uncharacterized protein n=1 Tax=Streblomastix strix TaxID=222440 RepID=A0A5J4X6F2_9EUKA|nr:MAG: hypothetical protein EZS28_001863 [Streblomastix strix]